MSVIKEKNVTIIFTIFSNPPNTKNQDTNHINNGLYPDFLCFYNRKTRHINL